MKSIRKNLFLIFTLFMLLLVVGNIVINVCYIKEYYMSQAKKRMKSTGKEIEKVYKENKLSVAEYIKMIDGTWGIWVRIADENYSILYTSKLEIDANNALSQGIVKIIEAGKNSLEEDRYYFSEMSKEEDNIVRLVYVKKMYDEKYMILTRPIKSVNENIEATNQLAILTSFVLLVIGFIFIFYFSRSITKPILEISKNAKKISKLNFNERLNIKSNDEIGELAEAINEISDRLSVNIIELKNDISGRKELVRNMSHELKTPISAVKGYAEGLKYAVADTPEKMNKYCDVIIMECNRMDNLVKEMLELSKLESVNQHIQKEKFKSKKLIEEIRTHFGEQICNQQINFSMRGDENTIINGDFNLIERAAFNYIENAIHYTNKNGTIVITFGSINKGFLFQVYNSGSTVFEQDINNIWKVFYKTDKSRTREGDNYGVGLAIVKTTIDLHSGTVNVKNMEDGVEFSFWIPE